MSVGGHGDCLTLWGNGGTADLYWGTLGRTRGEWGLLGLSVILGKWAPLTYSRGREWGNGAASLYYRVKSACLLEALRE